MQLTQEYLKRKFVYDEESGWLFWKHDPTKPVNWNSNYAGKPAGSFRHSGYIAIGLNGTKYYAHQLIWLYVYGYWIDRVEHWDGNTSNNRLENLRECNQSQNAANADFGPLRGVERHGIKFRVRIWVNNVRIELGSYDTEAEALEAYKNGALEHFGEFAFCTRPS